MISCINHLLRKKECVYRIILISPRREGEIPFPFFFSVPKEDYKRFEEIRNFILRKRSLDIFEPKSFNFSFTPTRNGNAKENRYRDDWNRSKQRARERDRPINFVVDPAHTLPIVEFHDRAASW